MRKEILISLFFFLIATFIFTFPLIFVFNSAYYGIPGESSGFVSQNWWPNFAEKQKLDKNFCAWINAPFGFDSGQILPQPVSYNLSLLVSKFFGEIVAYNVLVIISFTLSGFFMFLLVFEISQNFWAGLFSGLYFTLSPFHYSHFYHSINLGNIHWLPLFLFCFLKTMKNRGFFWSVLAALALAVVILDNFYYGFFMLIFLFYLVLLLTIFSIKNNFDYKITRLKIIKIFLILLISLVIIWPFAGKALKLARSFKSTTPVISQNLTRFYADLFRYSAKPVEYLIPPVDQPLWGRLAQKYFQHHLHSSNLFEQTLYLGYLPLLLTIMGVFLVQKQSREKTIFWLFLLAGIFSFYSTLSPRPNFFGIRLFTPSYFLYKFFPMFRVYSRMAVFVIICLAVTSGISLKWLLEKFKNNFAQKVFIWTAMALVVLEFINCPPQKLVSLKPSDSSLWLAGQPGDFIVAQYPLASSIEPSHFVYVLEQRIHQKKLFNGALSGTYPDQLRSEVIDLNQPASGPLLARLGVKYVVINKKIFQNGRVPPENAKYFDPAYLENLPAEWNSGQPFELAHNKNFKIAAVFKEADIYQVIARPAEIQIVWAQNFWPPERWEDKYVWRWLWQDGTIEITNFSKIPKNLTFEFKTRSFAQARSLSAFLDNNLLKKWAIPEEKIIQLTPLSLKVPTGKHFLKFTATPGPQNIHATLGNLDGRDVSIALSGKITSK